MKKLVPSSDAITFIPFSRIPRHSLEKKRFPMVRVARRSTGLSVLTTDVDGFDHSIIVEVKDPHDLVSSCPAGVSPCLADGSLRVVLDGEEMLIAPGTVPLGDGVSVSAANLPGSCRSFGFEQVRRTRPR